MKAINKVREDYLKGISNYFKIEYPRVRALALALGESEDTEKLILELEYINKKN